ncbi:MAG: hypothetical protein AAB303_00185, partial [Chloroflexota bacterium]
MAAPSAANVNGTVGLDKAWYSTAAGGNSVIVTVTDADANVATAASELKTLAASAPLGTQLVSVTLGAGERVGSPKILLVGQTCPSGTVDTNLSVSVFGDGSTGNIIVQNATNIAAPVPSTPVCYNKVSVNTLAVTVKSGLDTTGLVALTATETGVDTGIFKVTI